MKGSRGRTRAAYSPQATFNSVSGTWMAAEKLVTSVSQLHRYLKTVQNFHSKLLQFYFNSKGGGGAGRAETDFPYKKEMQIF